MSELSSVDDIWARMKDGEAERIIEYKKRASELKQKSDVSVVDLIAESEARAKKKSASKRDNIVSKGKIKNLTPASIPNQQSAPKSLLPVKHVPTKKVEESTQKSSMESSVPAMTVVNISPEELLTKISRDLNYLGSEEVNERRRALTKIYRVVFQEHTMSAIDFSEVFSDVCKQIFKRFADASEKCREVALKITEKFFEKAADIVPVLGYFFPVLMQRLPPGIAYDEDMKVFVTDIESHEAYRRGKAVERQDRVGVVGTTIHTVVETSEEIRLAACRTLGTLIKKVISASASSVLHPYFHETVMFLQMQLRDPFPDLKLEACEIIELLARTEEFNSGMKFFAVALVRAILPVLRHRHAKVRVAAVSALTACMVVPDRLKMKGSGTEAITDLVGFREENVLPVSAFYTSDVQINYLAEIMSDKSVQVREKVVQMLTEFLTEMGDRYDHQTRLVPYLLDLLTDEADTVSAAALACLRKCGQQYEDEHPGDIIERRQYGVDGDKRINLDKPLPTPFTERPRIGVRLYVRGNTHRFLMALVNELTNWVSHTRLKSARLLKVVIVLCEEHLTMETHKLLPAFIKALMFAKDDGDKELLRVLSEVFELFGRYTLPEAYLHFILPRLRGDPEVTAFGADTPTRVAVMELLLALIDGSKSTQLAAHLEDIVFTICDPFVIDLDSPKLQAAALEVLIKLLEVLKGNGKAAVEAHYLATGRLKSLQLVTDKLFRFFVAVLAAHCGPILSDQPSASSDYSVVSTTQSEMKANATLTSMKKTISNPLCDRAVIGLLATLPMSPCSNGCMGNLFVSHGLSLLRSILETEDSLSELDVSDLKLLQVLVESPWFIAQSDSTVFEALIVALCGATSSCASTLVSDKKDSVTMMVFFSRLLASTLLPVVYFAFPATLTQFASYHELYDRKAHLLTTAIPSNKSLSGVPKTEPSEFIREEIQLVLDDSDGIMWPGMVLIDDTRHDIFPAALDVIVRHLAEIVDVFVLDARWSRLPALQMQRCEIVSIFTGFSQVAKCNPYRIYGISRPIGINELNQLLPQVTSCHLPLIIHTFQSECCSESAVVSALQKYASGTICAILSAANVPSTTPIKVRCLALQITTFLVELLAEQAGFDGRLRSFACQQQLLTSAQSVEAKVPNARLELKSCKTAINEPLKIILKMLDDGADEVRLEVMSCLQAVVPLVTEDYTRSSTVKKTQPVTAESMIPNSTKDDEMSVDNVVDPLPTFTFIVERLLRELCSHDASVLVRTHPMGSRTSHATVGDDTEETAADLTLTDLIDGTLRGLATLEPAMFQALVRKAIDAVAQRSDGSLTAGSRLSEALSGLLDHSEMLAEFQNMQMKG